MASLRSHSNGSTLSHSARLQVRLAELEEIMAASCVNVRNQPQVLHTSAGKYTDKTCLTYTGTAASHTRTVPTPPCARVRNRAGPRIPVRCPSPLALARLRTEGAGAGADTGAAAGTGTAAAAAAAAATSFSIFTTAFSSLPLCSPSSVHERFAAGGRAMLMRAASLARAGSLAAEIEFIKARIVELQVASSWLTAATHLENLCLFF